MLIAVLVLFTLILVAVALVSNWQRRRMEVEFELTPNCLLTRYPIIFVSGTRSLFYFLRYWNIYPVYLAEHGYEVYNLALPWRNSRGRFASLLRFLEDRSQQGEKFHFVVDAPTAEEFRDLLTNQFSCLRSLTVLPYVPAKYAPPLPFLQHLSLIFHRVLSWPHRLPPQEQLGIDPTMALKSAPLLLAKAQELAEADFQES